MKKICVIVLMLMTTPVMAGGLTPDVNALVAKAHMNSADKAIQHVQTRFMCIEGYKFLVTLQSGDIVDVTQMFEQVVGKLPSPTKCNEDIQND